MKKILILIVLLVGGVYFYGRSLPREHKVASSITLVVPVDTVWFMVRHPGASNTWWSDVKSVRRLDRPRESYEQNMGAAGIVSTEIVSEDPPRRLVTRILNDEQQDFGGTWTYVVRNTDSGTELMITEDGWIESPFFRVIAQISGLRRTINSYLTSLGAHFGETVTPRDRS
ncbi:MAG: SRPBCC family protein [Gemmatimonadota bacterium]|nr:SRPBCC family protein [Gemmatimonadota bacterium]